MGLLDTFRGSSSEPDDVDEQATEQLADDENAGEETTEQLAEDDPDPRAEQREPEHSEANMSWLVGYRSVDNRVGTMSADTAPAPENIREYWRQYYKEFALTRAPLKLFDEAVADPGYKIRCEDANGERDDEMETALKLWASNAVIHAGETNQDLSILIERIPSQRRGKGTVFVEKVGTRSDRNTIAALMMLDPSTMDIHKRENQTILIHPEDDVDPEHPRTPDREAAAYEQYADSVSEDEEPIAFSKDDIIKFVYDPDTGEAWGTSIFEAIDDRIDSLLKKLGDRDIAIRQTGWQHRIYHCKNWSKEQATDFAKSHQNGEVSAKYGPDDEEDNPFAGRVDFVPEEVGIETVEGNVPEIDGAIMDDVQQIFSVMPVSRFKIAYEEGINQFVVEPQAEKDDRAVHKERRYLERKLEPVLEEKADELAAGDRYEGDVHFSIEPPEDENPLRRDSFPAENLETLTTALQEFKQSGAEMDLPVEALFELAGIDLERYQQKYDWDPDPLEIDDEDDTTDSMPDVGAENDEGTADEGDDVVDEDGETDD